MATPTIVRQINALRTLRALRLSGPSTRAELARQLNVTKGTLSAVAVSLLRAGLIVDLERPEGGVRVGRPGTLLSLHAAGAYFLGAEIGVDRFTVVALDLERRIVDSFTKVGDITRMDANTLADELSAGVMALRERAAIDEERIQGICVAVPGFVRDGRLLSAKILGWRDIDVATAWRDRFPFPVSIANDANASAFAEWYLDGSQPGSDLLLVLLESGVGAGLVASGRLMLGSRGLAGEIGFMPMGEPAACSLGVQPVILQDIIGKGAFLDACALATGEPVTLDAVVARVIAGEQALLRVTEHWGRWLGRALGTLVLAHDPEVVVVGGEMAALFGSAEATMTTELERILPPEFPRPRIVAARFRADGAAVGAAALGHAALFAEIDPVAM